MLSNDVHCCLGMDLEYISVNRIDKKIAEACLVASAIFDVLIGLIAVTFHKGG